MSFIPKSYQLGEILCAQLSFVKQYTMRTTVQMNNNRSRVSLLCSRNSYFIPVFLLTTAPFVFVISGLVSTVFLIFFQMNHIQEPIK